MNRSNASRTISARTETADFDRVSGSAIRFGDAVIRHIG